MDVKAKGLLEGGRRWRREAKWGWRVAFVRMLQGNKWLGNAVSCCILELGRRWCEFWIDVIIFFLFSTLSRTYSFCLWLESNKVSECKRTNPSQGFFFFFFEIKRKKIHELLDFAPFPFEPNESSQYDPSTLPFSWEDHPTAYLSFTCSFLVISLVFRLKQFILKENNLNKLFFKHALFQF